MTRLLKILAASAALVGVATAATAEAQPASDSAAGRLAKMRLCQAAQRGLAAEGGKSKGDILLDTLYTAAGTSSSEAPDVRKRKVAAIFKQAEPVKGSRPLPYCDGSSLAWQGTVFWRAADSWAPELVTLMVEEGADINFRDSGNGRTLLDEVWDKSDTWMRQPEEYAAPHQRVALGKQLLDMYHRFRELGARHAFELDRPVPSLDAQERACLKEEAGDAPGEVADYAGGLSKALSALTPGTVPGGARVSARQAACLMTAYGDDIFIIGSINDDVGLPGAIKFPFVGYSGTFEDQYQTVSREMVKIADNRPILVYCHSVKCFLSYNAVLRLSQAGARKIYWLREGLGGWKAAGYPTQTPDSFLYGRATGK